MTEEHHMKKDTNGLFAKIGAWTSVLTVVLLLVISLQLSDLNKGLKGGSVGAPIGAPDLPPGQNAPSPTVDMKALEDDDTVLGDKNAPVTIIEWSDYECPFCARFHTQTFAQIKSKYIDTGKVKFIYRDFPLSFHPQAQKAAEASECAGDQGKFWEMHEKLFTTGVAGGVSGFKQYAKDLGLNTATFDSCLDSGKHAAEVQKDTSDGSNSGITGTPGFLVNGKLVVGAQPFAAFEQAIEAALK